MKQLFVFLSLFSVILVLNGCAGSSSEGLGGTHFYSLTSLPPSAIKNNTLRIGVGPIEMPMLINRPQIVTRKDETEIIMAELHQWGGSHKEELHQVLIDNLSSLLKTESIEKYPWKFSFKPQYQVRINIERLDGELGKAIILKARWWLLKNGKKVLVKRAVINTKILGSSYSDYVKSQSLALRIFSQEIAKAIGR